MKKIMTLAAAGALTLSVAACNTPASARPAAP
jgi:predicted small secreted protein